MSEPFETDFPRPTPGAATRLFASASDWSNNACITRGDWGFMAEGFRRAARHLAETVIDTGCHQDTWVFPIVFNYRQFVELKLKEMVLLGAELVGSDDSYRNKHGLLLHWRIARPVLEEVELTGDRGILDAVEQVITQFDQVDGGSFAFRYPVDRGGAPVLPEWLTHLNIRVFSDELEKVANFLDGATSMVSSCLDWKRERERAYQG